MAFRNCDIATRSPPPKNGAFFALEIGLSPRIAVLRTVAYGALVANSRVSMLRRICCHHATSREGQRQQISSCALCGRADF